MIKPFQGKIYLSVKWNNIKIGCLQQLKNRYTCTIKIVTEK